MLRVFESFQLCFPLLHIKYSACQDILFPDIFVTLNSIFCDEPCVLKMHALQTQLLSSLFKCVLLWRFVRIVAVHDHLSLLSWGTSHMNPIPSRLKQNTSQVPPKLDEWPYVITTPLRCTVPRASFLTEYGEGMDATSWWGHYFQKETWQMSK